MKKLAKITKKTLLAAMYTIEAAATVWMCLVAVNAQAVLKRGEARSLCEAVAVAARMPLV